MLDDARFRAFDTMEEYRTWCDENLPSWLALPARASPVTGKRFEWWREQPR